jgi:hypothetical protein
MSFFFRARLTQATDESSANLVSDIAGYSPSTFRRGQILAKISSKGKVVMNDTNTSDVTRYSRPGKNPSTDPLSASPRIVSEPLPLIGSGLKIKLSDYSTYEQTLAHTLVRERMYSSVMERANRAYTPAPITYTKKSFFLATGLSFLAGVAVTTAAVMAVL